MKTRIDKNIRLILILLSFVPGPMAYGESYDSFLLAESAAEMVDVLATNERLDEIQQNCQREMAKSLFPDNCMVGLEIQSLHVSNPASWKRQWSMYSEICEKTVGVLKNLKRARHWHSKKEITPECRFSLEERIKDLEYMEK